MLADQDAGYEATHRGKIDLPGSSVACSAKRLKVTVWYLDFLLVPASESVCRCKDRNHCSAKFWTQNHSAALFVFVERWSRLEPIIEGVGVCVGQR